MMNLDCFEQTAAWLEFCDGMSRFHAETESARRQGFKRWEMLNAIKQRDFEQPWDPSEAFARKPANDLPELQPYKAKENGHLPECQFSDGWSGLEMLALRKPRRRVL